MSVPCVHPSPCSGSGKRAASEPGLEVGEDRVGDPDRKRADRFGRLRLGREPRRGGDQDGEKQQTTHGAISGRSRVTRTPIEPNRGTLEPLEPWNRFYPGRARAASRSCHSRIDRRGWACCPPTCRSRIGRSRPVGGPRESMPATSMPGTCGARSCATVIVAAVVTRVARKKRVKEFMQTHSILAEVAFLASPVEARSLDRWWTLCELGRSWRSERR